MHVLRTAKLYSQSEKLLALAIITVAITGSMRKKSDTPAVSVTPEEQIESTQEAYEAGASLVHIHFRNPDQSPGSSPEVFERVQEGIAKHCPGMIIQFSAGGRGRTRAERALALDLKPDMATLSTGSCNFTNWIFENPPDFIDLLAQVLKDNQIEPEIDVFGVSMLYSARSLADRGLIRRPLHVQFVMGVQNTLPVRRSLLEFLVSELRALEPGATVGGHRPWTQSARGK